MPTCQNNRRSRSRRLGGMCELDRNHPSFAKPGIGGGLRASSADKHLVMMLGALDRVLARVGGDIVLVGHAYAGAVIGATKNERVRLLVYVAALAPDEGETVADVFYRESPHAQAPKLAPDDGGFIWMPPEGFEHAFAQDAAPDVKSVLLATQRPINVKCIQEKAPRPLWKDKPSWFLVAENDRMIPAKTQHFQAGRMGATVRAHAVDHSPMLTASNVVVDVLLEAIRNTFKDA